MFGSLGMPELIFILVLALLIFGPKRLPQVGRTLGRGLREFRQATSDLKRTVETEISAVDVEPPRPTPAPLPAPDPAADVETPEVEAPEAEVSETEVPEGEVAESQISEHQVPESQAAESTAESTVEPALEESAEPADARRTD